jgi:uncharacterized protein YdaU (DUF1376 family)
MKFYKRDPDRALAGMSELTLKQRGAYNSILDLLYARDGDVPDDDARVARMISCHWREWKAVKAELIALGKIWVEGGKIRARRVQETLKEASDFAQEQSKKASSGWQKRKNQNENKEPEMPTGNALIDTPIDIDREREPTTPEHRDQAKAALAHGREVLTDWEKQFLGSLLSCRTLSRSQRDKFAAIREKLAELVKSGATSGADEWPKRLAWARENRAWSYRAWGPAPREPGCKVPPDLLQHGDGIGWDEWKAA